MNDKVDNTPIDKESTVGSEEGKWSKLTFGISSLHIFILCCWSIAKPLFDVTAKGAEFYVVRGSNTTDILSVIILLNILMPLVLVTIEGIIRLFSTRLQAYCHLMFVACLVSLFGIRLVKVIGVNGTISVVLALTVGIVLTYLYMNIRRVRLAVSTLAPICLIFPFLFVFNSPVGKIIKSEWLPKSNKQDKKGHLSLNKKPPIVFVLMDELPTVSLLDAKGNIDSKRFPNIAEFSKTAYWFRNATAVAAETVLAVPAVLDGIQPTKRTLPNLSDHPDNLFTLLANEYNFNVYESETSLCPEQLSGRHRGSLSYMKRTGDLLNDLSIVYAHIILPQEFTKYVPAIANKWGKFASANSSNSMNDFYYDKPKFFRKFVNNINANTSNTLNFIHIELPHVPFQYLPSGKQYFLPPQIAGFDSSNGDKFVGPQGLVTQRHIRHLLQTAFMDKLLGELFEHLKTNGLYDKAIIILTTDHGVSFKSGDYRRYFSKSNAADIMLVPLLVKKPGQKQGVISESVSENIDIVPTIADLLGIQIQWKLDGKSLFNQVRQKQEIKYLIDPNGLHSIQSAELFALRNSILKRNTNLFGLDKTDSTPYWFGNYRYLMGKSVSEVEVRAGNFEVQSPQTKLFESVDANKAFVPAGINGRIISDSKSQLNPVLAVSVNGVIQAVVDTYFVGNNILFYTIIPDSCFNSGKNKLEFFAVSTGDRGQTVLMTSRQSNSVSYRISTGQITGSDGKSFNIVTDQINSHISELSRTGSLVNFVGWAVNTKISKDVEKLIIFKEGVSIFEGEPKVNRVNVKVSYHDHVIESGGFNFSLPSSLLKDFHNIRIFALSNNIASELCYDKLSTNVPSDSNHTSNK